MSARARRVDEAIRTFLGSRVPQLKDPRIGMVTITEVRTTGDLSAAEVFYTVLPDDPEALGATAEGLASASSLLRSELGRVLSTRQTPDLHFVHDPVPEQGRRIEELLRQTRSEDDARGDG